MSKIFNSTFRSQVVRIDEHEYDGCTFYSCIVEYGGMGPISLVNCTFDQCNWKLVGAAHNTIMFLRTMYSDMGEFGEMMVDSTFNSIKSSKNSA